MKCVGLERGDERFICSGCQRRTQEKVIVGGRQETPARAGLVTPGQQFRQQSFNIDGLASWLFIIMSAKGIDFLFVK